MHMQYKSKKSLQKATCFNQLHELKNTSSLFTILQNTVYPATNIKCTQKCTQSTTLHPQNQFPNTDVLLQPSITTREETVDPARLVTSHNTGTLSVYRLSGRTP